MKCARKLKKNAKTCEKREKQAKIHSKWRFLAVGEFPPEPRKTFGFLPSKMGKTGEKREKQAKIHSKSRFLAAGEFPPGPRKTFGFLPSKMGKTGEKREKQAKNHSKWRFRRISAPDPKIWSPEYEKSVWASKVGHLCIGQQQKLNVQSKIIIFMSRDEIYFIELKLLFYKLNYYFVN